ncbi:bacterio-opsin activator [Halorubrum sp. BOL3-1]|uniref:helix-turn-helix domain-containing protein n=1 Tax=Halorubrum sp. BOL3-1 TaxID=2497325 RepID=UPI0010051691|nr:helix-turn-helix domain-containing protein [Halorubrum sp. BOL3-1]QAU14258.1 bacterio-opsin activator [Halorubrum sp. BOL3-1]
MGTNDASERDGGHTISIEIDPDADIAAVLGEIAELDVDGARVRDVSDEERSAVPVDPAELTAVQRQTLLRAVEAGYYSDPREATLSDLAAEFDVSKSAVSQRLHGAEATIVRRVVEGMDREDRSMTRFDQRE